MLQAKSSYNKHDRHLGREKFMQDKSQENALGNDLLNAYLVCLPMNTEQQTYCTSHWPDKSKREWY